MLAKPPQIIQGDSLLIIPTLCTGEFDLVVADPPYSSGGLHQGSRNAPSGKKYTSTEYEDFHGDNMDALAWYQWSYTWLSQSYRVLKSGGYMLIFTDWRQLSNASAALQAAGFIWRGIFVWDKGGAARLPHTGYLRHQSEFVLWGTKGSCAKAEHVRSSYDGVFRCPVPSHKEHPTEKPKELYEHLLQLARPGAKVLDPFLGVGASGEAALSLGQNFTGIEYSEYYAQIARQRIERAWEESRLAKLANSPLSELAPRTTRRRSPECSKSKHNQELKGE